MSAIVAFGIASCDFKSGEVFTDETTEEYQLYDYYVDQYGNEGIVAYIYNPKFSDTKYILVISSDENILPWGPMSETIYKRDKITSNELMYNYYSIAMHQIMNSIGVEKFPAQAWCDAKNRGENHTRAGSWHLPSKEELSKIFGSSGNKLNALNSAISGIGGTPLTADEMYWTCCEDYTNYIKISEVETDYDSDNRAVIVTPEMKTYSNKDRWLKKNQHNVRAIKYVYFHE